MLGKVVKEELIAYDLTLLFSKEANDKEILRFFSEFFDDKNSYYIKEGHYCGFVKLAYKIKGRVDARVFSFRLHCLPSKISSFISYSNRSQIVLRTLIIKEKKANENFTPVMIMDKDEESKIEDAPYKDLVKNIVE